jgi:hypothetical protein
MSEEEKGFVIKDRRALDEKGELKEKDLNEEKKEPKEQAAKEEAQKPPLPEANFTSLIFSLSSSALFHFGEIPDPTTGRSHDRGKKGRPAHCKTRH